MQKKNGNVKTINKTKPTSDKGKSSLNSYTAIQEKKAQSGVHSLNGDFKIAKPEEHKQSTTKTATHTISLSKSVQNITRLKNNLKINESTNNIKEHIIYPNQSTKEIRTLHNNNLMAFSKSGMTRVNSLKPFPKIDPEFYSDNQNYFWNKELQRTNTERNILAKSESGKFLERNFSTFQKV
jgi:hypothetical protein